MTKKNLTYLTLLLCLTVFLCQAGCVYYNTFYNAKKAFNEAEKIREKNKYINGKGGEAQYQRAIEKSLKVIEDSPNTKYYDDALYVIGVSYYNTNEFSSASRRLRELLANYPESPYVKEAELYLAKAKLKLREETEAMSIFERIFNTDYEKSFKAVAAMELGQYYYSINDIVAAQPYFLSVRDSLGGTEEKKIAQKFIADGYFQQFKFDDALGAYLQLNEMDLDKNEKYHALYSASESAFNLMRIDDGMDYLNTLLNDEIYFDSTGSLLLEIAKGYEYDGNTEAAQDIYLNLAKETETNKRVAAEANYQLGLIEQLDNDNLIKAKEYYDNVVKLYRSNESGKDALQRSADIGKLETFARTVTIDSTTTQEMIDDAAFTQMQLAQLYWFSLDKPDSAIAEMQYVVDSFPTAYDTPSAMIALSEMYRDYMEDSTAADSILYLALERYPRSDVVPQALEILNLKDTPADTGYAKLYLEKAEDFYADKENIDSAKYYYDYIVEHFPESDLYLQARFASLWLTENYESPGDSSIYFAYNALVDSFPQSEWAQEANKIVRIVNREKQLEEGLDTTNMSDSLQSENLLAQLEDNGDVIVDAPTTEYQDPFEALYIDPNGNKAIKISIEPIQTNRKFVYPVEAYRTNWEGDLYFQILLDFSGEVSKLILKIKSPHEAIDKEASETVATMTFDMIEIPVELQESWFVYRFPVELPDKLR